MTLDDVPGTAGATPGFKERVRVDGCGQSSIQNLIVARPDPNDEAKAKAAEAAAKTAHAGKVDGYKLCKSQDKVAARYRKSGKPVATPPCADPGPFKPAAAAPAAPAKKS